MAHLSPAQRAGNLIFVSGQLAFDEQFQIAGDCATQTQRCLEHIQAILAQHGVDMSAIVKINSWLTDRGNFVEYDLACAAFFGEHRPARSTVISDLALETALVEIDAVAQVL